MRIQHPTLLALAALAVAPVVSAQITHTQLIDDPASASRPWTADSGNPGAGSDLSSSNATAYTATNTLGLSTGIVGTGSYPSEASALLDSYIAPRALSSSFDGDVWISFSAQRISGSGWANIKLLNTAYSNDACVLGIGQTTNDAYWQYGIGQSGSAPFTSTATLGSSTSLSTGSYFVIHIAYDPLANDDDISIWRSSSLISGVQTTPATATLNNIDATFDRFAIYAGADTTFAVSDITVALTVVPEPATYALLFGAATLGFVSYRRFRKRQA